MYLLAITGIKATQNSLQRDVQIDLKQGDRLTFKDINAVREYCTAKCNFINSMNEEYTRCSKKIGYQIFEDSIDRDVSFFVGDFITLHFYKGNDSFWKPDFSE